MNCPMVNHILSCKSGLQKTSPWPPSRGWYKGPNFSENHKCLELETALCPFVCRFVHIRQQDPNSPSEISISVIFVRHKDCPNNLHNTKSVQTNMIYAMIAGSTAE